MIAANYSDFKKNTKDYFNKTVDESETVIVTRKNRKNVIIMSVEHYEEMMRNARNAEYLAKLDRSFDQLEKGMGHMHELVEDLDDE